MNILSRDNMEPLEIKKGDFVYRDTLFVDVGDGRRHPRAAPSEIKDLLMPRRGTPAPKDQVARWYEAQLIHYGLTRSKDKNTAKVRLIAALNTEGLKVPSEIQKKESDMKKEYMAAVRKSKAAERNASSAATAPLKSNKRKAEDGSSTTISLKVDGVELTVNRKTGAVGETASKRKKAEPKKRASASTSTSSRTVPSPARPAAPSTPSQPRARQTARRSHPPSHYRRTSSRPMPSPQPIVNHTPNSFRENLDDDDDDAPPSYDSIDFGNNNEPPPPPVQVSGTYTIETEQTTSEMTLRIDKSKRQLWGRFEVGSTEGILFMDDIDDLTQGEPKSFSWRAEDTFNHQYFFRRDQTGWLLLDGDGGVRGCLSGLIDGYDVDFEGQLASDNAPGAPEYRFEWDKIPRMAYGRANN